MTRSQCRYRHLASAIREVAMVDGLTGQNSRPAILGHAEALVALRPVRTVAPTTSRQASVSCRKCALVVAGMIRHGQRVPTPVTGLSDLADELKDFAEGARLPAWSRDQYERGP
ncbi:MAG: hypothetical protein M3P23_09745 [Actinomycetota bacterium]|nr:hypothetical protein [Actinomycetota bacterium]